MTSVNSSTSHPRTQFGVSANDHLLSRAPHGYRRRPDTSSQALMQAGCHELVATCQRLMELLPAVTVQADGWSDPYIAEALDWSLSQVAAMLVELDQTERAARANADALKLGVDLGLWKPVPA